MIGLPPFEGAVDEQEGFCGAWKDGLKGWACPACHRLPILFHPVDNDGKDTSFMTLALLLVLAGSLGLMAYIVKRLEQA